MANPCKIRAAAFLHGTKSFALWRRDWMFDKGRDGAQYIHILVDSAVRLEYAMMSKTSIIISSVIKAMRR